MRGQILHYDDGLGSGLISGDDGARYEFRRADLQQLRPLRQGMRVDFVAEGQSAAKVYIIDNPGPQPATNAGAASAYNTALGDLETTNEDLGLWGYFAKAMAKSFSGEGRARRKEYWSFVLFQLIIVMGAIFAFAMIAGVNGYDYDGASYDASNLSSGMLALGMIIAVVVFIPAGITVTIRRLHDIGLTGWFIFLSLIPYLGSFILLIMSLIPSERRVNKHGPYPKPLD
ncbi:DUF805 domain-containing protein [Candidatus Viadribacter manganicus]|uniref:DUF805 domain-containing protein n=1 Tax=Candidatus Viadribacter manganicus TaxID=1759059 RepID=A0A1B1AG90_9PROT|nr:DUF805 domain-containing protein [Candidatus Viadribacter manganicus]ANP45555.1 hypothetical protein ATE48_06315 [Candidatus Viadribacter manganicus]